MDDLLNLHQMQERARVKLPDAVWDYFVGGSDDEVTLHENRKAFQKISIYPKILRDVANRCLATEVLGTPVSLPVLIAPTAFLSLACPDAEMLTAQAANAAGTILVFSTMCSVPLDEVLPVSKSSWFQLYPFRDNGITNEVIERVESAGCSALVVTVDMPVLGKRERDIRNVAALSLATKDLYPKWLPVDPGEMAMASGFSALFASSLTWNDIDRIRAQTHLPLVLKGVLRADDARRAVDSGVSGIIVSNHGGRQLDTAPATIDALADISDAVGSSAEVFLDGGVRRGTDVIKALARGAKAVLIGRPVLWALAIGGTEGVARMFDILRCEIDLAMALCGCANVSEIDSSLLNGR